MTNKMPPTSTAQAGDTGRRFLTVAYCSKSKSACQSPVADLLHHGAAAALSCRDLAALLGWPLREVTRQIQRERAAGAPICANSSGYYLPANNAELDAYLGSLSRRLREVERTHHAVAASRQQRMIFGGDT